MVGTLKPRRDTIRNVKANNMCLFPKLILNKKYLPTRKNNYNPPALKDARLKYVAVGCGMCIECRTQKAREWQFRLHCELQDHKYASFVTLTYDNEHFEKLCDDAKTKSDNAIAALSVRRFLERWRKKYGHSVKHWFVTELGHEHDRLHIHGIIFTDEPLNNDTLNKIWTYGYTDTGQYCNQRTINYIVKYIVKIDEQHKQYKPLIMCSAGLGKNYVNDYYKQQYKYIKGNSKEYVKLPNGQKIAMPIYLRNKFYTEEEREKLWLDRLDKDTIFIRGIEIKKISSPEGQKVYLQVLEEQQRENENLGYGDDRKIWKAQEYNATLRQINDAKRKKNKKK